MEIFEVKKKKILYRRVESKTVSFLILANSSIVRNLSDDWLVKAAAVQVKSCQIRIKLGQIRVSILMFKCDYNSIFISGCEKDISNCFFRVGLEKNGAKWTGNPY